MHRFRTLFLGQSLRVNRSITLPHVFISSSGYTVAMFFRRAQFSCLPPILLTNQSEEECVSDECGRIKPLHEPKPRAQAGRVIGVLFFRGDDAVATTALKRQRELRVMDRGGS